jgi:hypothetical protein
VLEPKEVGKEVLYALLHSLAEDQERTATMCIIEIEPVDDFLTYGVGVRMLEIRDTTKAWGRVPLN